MSALNLDLFCISPRLAEPVFRISSITRSSGESACKMACGRSLKDSESCLVFNGKGSLELAASLWLLGSIISFPSAPVVAR